MAISLSLVDRLDRFAPLALIALSTWIAWLLRNASRSSWAVYPGVERYPGGERAPVSGHGGVEPSRASIDQLCATLRRSYLDGEPGSVAAAQARAVLRGRLLDEIETRDPVGFAQWLAGEPLPGADPWGYLGAGRAKEFTGSAAATVWWW